MFEKELSETIRTLIQESNYALAEQLEAAWAVKRSQIESQLKDALAKHSSQLHRDQRILRSSLQAIVDRYQQ